MGMDRKIEKKKWPLKKIIGFFLGGLFVLIISYNIIFRDSSSKLNVEMANIMISTVEEAPFQEFIIVVGNVIPLKTVYLDAIEGGRIEEIFLDAGSLVKKGDEILRLSNTSLKSEIMHQESSLLDQSNHLNNTRSEMERQKIELQNKLTDFDYQINRNKRIFEQNEILLQNKIISKQEYEESKDDYLYNVKKRLLAIESAKQDSIFKTTQIEQLKASLKRLQENLKIVKQRLENLSIKAPVSGQLTSLNAESIGEIKSAGERLGQIDILDGFKIRAPIDEHYLSRININQNGDFDFSGKTYKLAIKKIYPEINDGRFNVDLEFIDEIPSNIRRGQSVHIRLELGDLSNAVILARGGFYQKTGGQWVYLLNESEKIAIKKEVRLGRQNPQYFEILEGLKPGEKVITSSYDNFGDADKLVLK